MTLPSADHPHLFWQKIEPAGTFDLAPPHGHDQRFPVRLRSGQELALPIRPLADSGTALASLIINQASFAVAEQLGNDLVAQLQSPPDVVVGLPTLGLTLAAIVARRLGHARYVPLGTSRKFWYDDGLSSPMRSITSPDSTKRLYLDPRMLPLLHGKKILLIDDVISTGSSLAAGVELLGKAGLDIDAIGVAMVQTRRWESRLGAIDPALVPKVAAAFETPLLVRRAERGPGWYADDKSD